MQFKHLFIRAAITVWSMLFVLSRGSVLRLMGGVLMQHFRTPLLTSAKLVLVVLMGVLTGLTFLGLSNDQLSIQNRFGALYFILISVMFGNSLSVVLTCSLLLFASSLLLKALQCSLFCCLM